MVMSLSERGTYIYIYSIPKLVVIFFSLFFKESFVFHPIITQVFGPKIKEKLKYINIKLMILKESHALKIHEIVPRDIPKQYYFYHKVENTLPYM